MENKIHFISGLPRAGSTLLSAILRQNPALHAAMTSPVGSLYMATETAMSRRNETSVFLDGAQRRALLRGVFAGYYHAADPATVIFDTNRLWCARLPALAELFPAAKIVCCVRPVSWIIDSIAPGSAQSIRAFGPVQLRGHRHRLYTDRTRGGQRWNGRLRPGRAARGVFRRVLRPAYITRL
jgi:hypothetical protein